MTEQAQPMLTRDEAHRILLNHLLRREVVVFVGAGVSLGAGLPSWKELVGQLGDQLPELAGTDLSGYDTLDLPQWYSEQHGREQLEDVIVRVIGDPKYEPSCLHRALAKLPVSLYFTTNYDELLERALEAQGERPDTIVDNRHVALLNDLTATTVVKMHGCVTLPDTIVLAREDYERYAERHAAIIAYLQSLLATRVVLFAGFSFADPNFRVIHEVIARALGPYQRRAYALMRGEPNALFARHWARRGIDFIALPDEKAITKFVCELGQEAGSRLERGTSLPHLLTTLGRREPPPVFQAAQRIEGQLDAVRDEVRALIADAAGNPDLQLIRRLPDGATESDARRDATLEKVRALHGLAQGLEGMGYPLDGTEWLLLGNALYQHREWELAIRAYTAAQRHTRGRERWAEGNLARCYLKLRQYPRAEAVLRRLVFAQERVAGALTLDEGWLLQRPQDLSELGYCVNRIAEGLRADARPDRALHVLRELRPWLRQGLDSPWLAVGAQGRDAPASRERQDRGLSGYTRAYLLNHLGKNYRLAYEIEARRQNRQEAERCRRQAVRAFVAATETAPFLLYPWAHLLDIYEQNLLHRRTAEGNLAKNVRLLDDLAAQHPHRGRKLRDRIKTRHQETWSRCSVPL